jgi:hypothetical protein
VVLHAEAGRTAGGARVRSLDLGPVLPVARQGAHERLRVTRLGAGYDPQRRIVNFAGKLVRSADNIRPRRPPQDFKGAADCVSGQPTLIVWSM